MRCPRPQGRGGLRRIGTLRNYDMPEELRRPVGAGRWRITRLRGADFAANGLDVANGEGVSIGVSIESLSGSMLSLIATPPTIVDIAGDPKRLPRGPQVGPLLASLQSGHDMA